MGKGISVYQIVQERFIAMIEEAIQGDKILPWQKPWTSGVPRNVISQRPYRGLNLFLLPSGMYKTNEYITWSQMQDLRKKNPDIQLKKGAKRHLIVYWNILEREVEQEEGEKEKVKLPLLRYYYVYNIEDCIAIESKEKRYEHDPIEEAEKVVQEYVSKENIELRIVEGSTRAFYSLSGDYIKVPDKSNFPDITEYYCTLYHEILHSSGSEKRLKRWTEASDSAIFGSDMYSLEELTAELGAQILVQMTIGQLGEVGKSNSDEIKKTEENSLLYLLNWLKVLKNDMSFVFKASSQAQKAVDYILGVTHENEQSSDDSGEEVA